LLDLAVISALAFGVTLAGGIQTINDSPNIVATAIVAPPARSWRLALSDGFAHPNRDGQQGRE
jgi:hypothetical protein